MTADLAALIRQTLRDQRERWIDAEASDGGYATIAALATEFADHDPLNHRAIEAVLDLANYWSEAEGGNDPYLADDLRRAIADALGVTTTTPEGGTP